MLRGRALSAALALASGCALVAGAGCGNQPATAVRVRVFSDIPTDARDNGLLAVRVRVFGDAHGAMVADGGDRVFRVGPAGDAHLPLEFNVTPGDTDNTFRVEVDGFSALPSPGVSPFVRTAGIGHFTSGETHVMDLFLREACRGTMCGETDVCVGPNQCAPIPDATGPEYNADAGYPDVPLAMLDAGEDASDGGTDTDVVQNDQSVPDAGEDTGVDAEDVADVAVMDAGEDVPDVTDVAVMDAVDVPADDVPDVTVMDAGDDVPDVLAMDVVDVPDVSDVVDVPTDAGCMPQTVAFVTGQPNASRRNVVAATNGTNFLGAWVEDAPGNAKLKAWFVRADGIGPTVMSGDPIQLNTADVNGDSVRVMAHGSGFLVVWQQPPSSTAPGWYVRYVEWLGGTPSFNQACKIQNSDNWGTTRVGVNDMTGTGGTMPPLFFACHNQAADVMCQTLGAMSMTTCGTGGLGPMPTMAQSNTVSNASILDVVWSLAGGPGFRVLLLGQSGEIEQFTTDMGGVAGTLQTSSVTVPGGAMNLATMWADAATGAWGSSQSQWAVAYSTNSQHSVAFQRVSPLGPPTQVDLPAGATVGGTSPLAVGFSPTSGNYLLSWVETSTMRLGTMTVPYGTNGTSADPSTFTAASPGVWLTPTAQPGFQSNDLLGLGFVANNSNRDPSLLLFDSARGCP